MPYQTILYSVVEPGILKITLNRPEVRNAVNDQLITELNAAYETARKDNSLGAIIVTGAGTAFSAGLDLVAYRGKSPLEFRRFIERFYLEMTEILYKMGKPVIAAVNGPVLAAGCSIAFSCDMVIASERAIIGYPEINVGLVPAMHLILLPRLVGKHKAFELAFTGEPISAKTAADIGLINHVVPHEKLEKEAMKFARNFAGKSSLVMKMNRDAFYRGLTMEFRAGIADAGDALAILASSDDALEGMTAFKEKRKPIWKGR
ncbi:MAG: enoyl-CoA hydratase/isomerase family protein [Pseudomonadota bacterium]